MALRWNFSELGLITPTTASARPGPALQFIDPTAEPATGWNNCPKAAR
ncbi:hypothetical protein [Streptomyces sp. NPDC006368]